jgi:hypothetical protein
MVKNTEMEVPTEVYSIVFKYPRQIFLFSNTALYPWNPGSTGQTYTLPAINARGEEKDAEITYRRG